MVKHTAWNDQQREGGTLTKVEGPHEGWFSVTSNNGWSCSVSAEYGVRPKVGDAFVTWGGAGFPIRGMALNGEVLYYRTPEQQDAQDALERDRLHAERVAEYEGKRADFDRRVAALPDPLRQRVEAFRAFKGDAWRYSFEPYEVMCCEEAVKMRARFPSAEALRAFAAMKYDAQRAAFPEMEPGHSGNSFSFSVRLALLMVERPDLIVLEHGALCPLAGCEEYGCPPARPKLQSA